VAGAVFGEFAVSLFVAGATCGEVHIVFERDFSWKGQYLVKQAQYLVKFGMIAGA